ncbi:MAG: acyl-ACP--UDP-N-acetylglucosamine O-acyltransferase [Bacillota bacterium]
MKAVQRPSFRMRKIHDTAIIHPGARIGQDVTIGPYCIIGEDVVIGDGCKLASHVVIDGPTIIGKNCTFSSGARIGVEPQDYKFNGEKTTLVIGDNNVFREYTTVSRGTVTGHGETRIGDNNMVMSYGHIAHDCRIGNHTVITGGGALAGHCTLEDYAIIGGMAGVHQFVKIGKMAMIGAMAKVTKDVPPYMLVDGNPARVIGVNIVGMRRNGVPLEVRDAVRRAYKILYESGLNLTQAIGKIETELSGSGEIEGLLQFLKASCRGVIAGHPRGVRD